MKRILVVVMILTACVFVSHAQEAREAYITDGNVFLRYQDGTARQLTNTGSDSQVALSADKKFLVWLRIVASPLGEEKDDLRISETSVHYYDIAADSAWVLIQGCDREGKGSTPFRYADSDKFPFEGLCNIGNVKLSPDGSRVYFETDAWVVCPAVHYYEINSKQIEFFHAGILNFVSENGDVNIAITWIEKDYGRYWQNWLYDKNGKAIRATGERE